MASKPVIISSSVAASSSELSSWSRIVCVTGRLPFLLTEKARGLGPDLLYEEGGLKDAEEESLSDAWRDSGEGLWTLNESDG